MYGHAHLLLNLCERCNERPQIVVTDNNERLCARCGLTEEQAEEGLT